MVMPNTYVESMPEQNAIGIKIKLSFGCAMLSSHLFHFASLSRSLSLSLTLLFTGYMKYHIVSRDNSIVFMK